jgi:hypothetical protein
VLALKARNLLTLDPATLTAIGRSLRGYYADTLKRPVPEPFLALLQRLERLPSGAGDARREEPASRGYENVRP